MLVKEVIKETLKSIQRDGMTVTPELYAQTFCRIAKKAGLDLAECRPAQKFVDRLPEAVRKRAKARKIMALEDLIVFMTGELQRALSAAGKNGSASVAAPISALYVHILGKSLTPSFDESLFGEINRFIRKLLEAPSLFFEHGIQKELLDLVGERISPVTGNGNNRFPNCATPSRGCRKRR